MDVELLCCLFTLPLRIFRFFSIVFACSIPEEVVQSSMVAPTFLAFDMDGDGEDEGSDDWELVLELERDSGAGGD